MKKAIAMTVLALVGMIGLSGCPNNPTAGTIVIHNISDSANILEIHFQGPNDAGFGDNMLDGQLAPGQDQTYEVDAPFSAENADGVTYKVQVKYEILDIFQPTDEATFNCLNAGETANWFWAPGRNEEICVQ